MSLDTYQLIFQAVAFLFACCVHECAHAWMASRCGDDTARLLGRITLNPIKHIDPIGTILLPAICLYQGGFFVGWAKPTPVDPRQFKHPVWDDIKTTLAGPGSNLLIATGSVVVLAVIAKTSGFGHDVVMSIARSQIPDSKSVLVPLTLLAFSFLEMNILLTAFNLIPIPPLDGSHVVRHFLPERIRQIYDTIGMFGLVLLFLVGGRVIGIISAPFYQFFGSIIARL